MVFRVINNDATKLTDKLFLFRKSFTDIGKDLKNGIGIKSFTSIVTSKDVDILKAFNNSIKSGTNYTKAFDTYLSKVPMSIKRQGNELIQLNNQMLKLNNSYKNGKITKQEYNTQMNALNGRINNVIQSTRTLTVSERIATVVTKGLGVALNLAFNIGLGIAINLLVTAIYKLINAQKEYNEKTKELAENICQEKKEIKDLYKQYVDISKEYAVDRSKKEDLIKITDDLLEKLGHEKTTIQELVDEYGNLDNAIQNITYENLKEKRGTLSNAKDVAENELKDKYKSIDKNLINNYENYIRANIGWDKFWDDIGGDFIEEYRIWFQKKFSVENAEQFIIDTNEFISKLEDSYYQNDLKKIKIYSALVNARDDLKKSLDEYNASVDNVNKNEAEMAIALARINTELPKTQEEFNVFKNSIIDTVLASDNFKKHFVGDEKEIERVITNVLKETPEFTSFFTHDLPDSTNKNTLSVKKFTSAYEDLSEVLDDIIDKQEKLADAFKKIQRGAVLSAQEIYELIKEMPDLAQYIERTTDGYSISDKGISAVAEKNQRQARENAEKDLENIRENIALLEKRDELEKKRDELEKEMISSNGSLDTFRRWDNADVEYHKAVEACQGISDTLEELKSAEQAVLVAQGVLDEVFNGFAAVENYEDAKSEISEYNKDIQTLDKAIRSLNEGTSLSYGEMVEIVDIAPDLQVFFEEMEDGYTISADKIEWWSRKTKTARDQYIQSLIEQAEAEKKTAEEERDAAKAALDAADAANKAAAAIQYSIAQQNVDNIDEVIKKYKALMSELKSPDDKNSISDALQNEIDYYKNILEAVQIVHDKYNDSLEREKEYLEDVKDSLKDANDERQREIELREAAINLENAKKRKVYVYSEGEGFKQVSDEGAIKEAEEKYRDAIVDAQEAELDKQIDAIEKVQETLDKRVEDLTSLEQDIENANTVEQAKSALGLADEKDLLNLPEAVKDGIKNGLAEVLVEKSNQKNKDKTDRDGNSLYTPATLDDVLKSIGATVTADDIKSMASELPAQAAYNAAVKGFADSLNEFRESLVNSASVVNNGGVVINNSFTINDASDAEKVGEVVEDHISDLLTRYCNSIK